MRRAEYDSHLSLRAMQDVPVSYQDELDLDELDEGLDAGGEHRAHLRMSAYHNSGDAALRPCILPTVSAPCPLYGMWLYTDKVERVQCEAYRIYIPNWSLLRLPHGAIAVTSLLHSP